MSDFASIRAKFERASSSNQVLEDNNNNRPTGTSSTRPQPYQPYQPPKPPSPEKEDSDSSSSSGQTPEMDPDVEIANHYKQMLRDGMPNDVVMKEMINNGVQPHIMSQVLSSADDMSSEEEEEEEEEDDEEDEEEEEEEPSEPEPEPQQQAEEDSGYPSSEDEFSSEDEDEDYIEEEVVDEEGMVGQRPGEEEEEVVEEYEQEDQEVMAFTAEAAATPFGAQPSSRSQQPPDAQQQAEQQAFMSSSDPFASDPFAQPPPPPPPPDYEEEAEEEEYEEEVISEGEDEEFIEEELPESEHQVMQSSVYHDEPPQNNFDDFNKQQINQHEAERFDDEAFSNQYFQDPEQAKMMNQDKFDDDDNSDTRKKKQLYRWIMIACIFLAFAVVSLGVLLFLWLKDDDNDSDKSRIEDLNGTTAPTLSPAPSSSPAPTTSNTGNFEPIELFSTQSFSFSSTSAAVQIAGSWVAVSDPSLGNGTVSLMLENSQGDYELNQELSGSSFGSEFGAQVAFSNIVVTQPFMLIGAPLDAGRGAAFYYVYHRGDKEWRMEGTKIASGSGSAGVDERFGAAVALSDSYHVVVGAPNYGSTNVGRCYTFKFEQIPNTSEFDWVPLSNSVMVGTNANANFGSAVDITRDGALLAVGSPGDSSFRIYEWKNNDWELNFELSVPEAVNLGSEVLFLTNKYVAVGAPSANGGDGLIMLFESVARNNTNTWDVVGTLEGGRGERIGSFGTMAGSEGSNGLELVVATATGAMERYDSSGLNRRFRKTEIQAPISSIDISSDNQRFRVVVAYEGDGTFILEEGEESRTSSLTPAPTPTPAPKQWQLTSSGQLQFALSNTGFGNAVATTGSGDFVAVGMPNYSNRLGAVQSYKRSGTSPIFAERSLLTDPQSEEFGSAVDVALLSDGRYALLVGATDTDGQTTVSAFGSAYYYEENGSGWTQIGTELRGGETLEEGGGKHGQSVAMASTRRRVAVASPSSSVSGAPGLNNGRVFTYEYDDDRGDWVQMTAPLIGEQIESFFGTGLSMSANGQRLLIGAPGGGSSPGVAQILTWSSGSWFELERVDGSSGESLGTSTAIITSNGSQFALGGPGFSNGRGVVRVFGQSSTNGDFSLLGTPIVGNSGERIGSTLCGENGRIAFGVNTGLNTGSFRVYEFADGNWVPVGVSPVINSRVVSISMNDSGTSVVVGLLNQEVRVYGLE